MSKEQSLIVMPEYLQKRLAKRLKENGMVMFTRIEVYKQGVAFFWDGVGGGDVIKGVNGDSCTDPEPICPGALVPCCQGDEWSCCPPS